MAAVVARVGDHFGPDPVSVAEPLAPVCLQPNSFGWRAETYPNNCEQMELSEVARSFITLALLGVTSARAGDISAEPECFDALVSASIERQTPTVVPDCGDDCIIMRWPWVIELDVERVIKGKVPSGTLTALTVQHTYYRTDLGATRWWLRRNSLGAFNVLHHDEKARLDRCPAEMPPAKPYIQPEDGRMLRDLVREGEGYYGKQP